MPHGILCLWYALENAIMLHDWQCQLALAIDPDDSNVIVVIVICG